MVSPSRDLLPSNLFIVGAPRCGTTTVYEVLRGCEDVYFPDRKEINYLGSDLRYTKRRSRSEYESLYEGAGAARWRGDASVFLLYSQRAAAEIAAGAPNGRVVVLLRHPVEQMWSLWAKLRTTGTEPLTTFEEALAAEPGRRAGHGVPRSLHPHAFHYRDLARYPQQLQRFRDELGPDRVCVVLFDDLVGDSTTTLCSVVQFLGLRTDAMPAVPHANAAAPLPVRVGPRGHRLLRRVLRSRERAAWVSTRMERLGSSVLPARFPSTMRPETRARLLADTSEDVSRLEDLLHRDLSAWRV